jgi:methyltransferase-like protein/SAM-dependent methyltransferase
MSSFTNFIDMLPYTSQPMPYTHPHHLASIGQLFGMQPANPQRVLELACGDGSNILGIAQTLPRSECWGVDLYATHIAKAKQLAEQAKLNNLVLKAEDIFNFDAAKGTFDYIIAHGIYSWSSKALQQRILYLCQNLLSPNGIAYISYDTYPANDDVVQRILRYHLQHITNEQTRLEQAYAVLEFLIDANFNKNTAYSLMLQAEYNKLQRIPRPELYLAALEEEHHSILFTDFAQSAAAHGLQYLGDTDIASMLPHNLPATVQADLHQFEHDLWKQEQYLDFARGRKHRHSLLVHANTELHRDLTVDLLDNFYLSCDFVFKEVAHNVVNFASRYGTVQVPDSIVIKVLDYFGRQYPRYLQIDELLAATNISQTEDINIIKNTLFDCCMQGSIGLHRFKPHYTHEITAQPFASPLARAQLSAGMEQVTNLQNLPVKIDNPLCRELLPYLDGQHQHSDLLQILQLGLNAGHYELHAVQADGIRLELPPAHLPQLLIPALENSLQLLSKAALLIK